MNFVWNLLLPLFLAVNGQLQHVECPAKTIPDVWVADVQTGPDHMADLLNLQRFRSSTFRLQPIYRHPNSTPARRVTEIFDKKKKEEKNGKLNCARVNLHQNMDHKREYISNGRQTDENVNTRKFNGISWQTKLESVSSTTRPVNSNLI